MTEDETTAVTAAIGHEDHDQKVLVIVLPGIAELGVVAPDHMSVQRVHVVAKTAEAAEKLTRDHDYDGSVVVWAGNFQVVLHQGQLRLKTDALFRGDIVIEGPVSRETVITKERP